MKEKYDKTVTFKDITPDAMNTLLEFLYTERIVLTEDNVANILQAASIMQIQGTFASISLKERKVQLEKPQLAKLLIFSSPKLRIKAIFKNLLLK